MSFAPLRTASHVGLSSIQTFARELDGFASSEQKCWSRNAAEGALAFAMENAAEAATFTIDLQRADHGSGRW